MRRITFTDILGQRHKSRAIVNRIDAPKVFPRHIENIADKEIDVSRTVFASTRSLRNFRFHPEFGKQLFYRDLAQFGPSNTTSLRQKPSDIERLAAQRHKPPRAFPKRKPVEVLPQNWIRFLFMKRNLVLFPTLMPKSLV